MKIVAVVFATSVTSPVVRSAQARPIDRIMDAVPHVSITPPIPEPAELMPLAKLRFCENHCERIAMLGIIISQYRSLRVIPEKDKDAKSLLRTTRQRSRCIEEHYRRVEQSVCRTFG